MGRTACTEPQCLYKGDLYLYLYVHSAHPSLPMSIARNLAQMLEASVFRGGVYRVRFPAVKRPHICSRVLLLHCWYLKMGLYGFSPRNVGKLLAQ